MAASRRLVALMCLGLLTAGCSSSGSDDGAAPTGETTRDGSPSASSSATAGDGHETHAAAPAAIPLRAGESFRTLRIPGGAYTPAAPAGGLDDYHCFLLDPDLTADRFITGANVLPDNIDAVHHAILFTVAPDRVAEAEAYDEQTPGRGWTCFGGSALPGGSGEAGRGLDAAPWLAGWAPGGGESVFRGGTGKLVEAGSRVVLQLHYNLRESTAADDTAVRLRFAERGADLAALQTMLLVAPVELPCLPEESGELCDRQRSLTDLVARFGIDSGRTVNGLQLLCGGDLRSPRAGPTQRCDRRVPEDMRVRAVAGHMHLLGRSITVTHQPGTPAERTLLDRKVWNFDDQRATPLKRPARVSAGDTLRVTCTHDASLRGMLPELADEPPRYVTWGEGTSDEMCLGIVLYTRD